MVWPWSQDVSEARFEAEQTHFGPDPRGAFSGAARLTLARLNW